MWGRKKEEEMIERTKENEQMKERESEMKEKRMEWVCIQKNDRRSRPEKGGMKEGRKEISP